jgi:hypothetical protein
MTFEGQYLTKTDYIELGGSAIEQMPFDLLEFEARRKIDIRTQNRLKEVDYSDLPQEVKLCEYALINSIRSFAETTTTIEGSGNIASEGIDGYSISYLTPDRIGELVNSINTQLEDTIRTYLLEVKFNGEHLMYLGV